jgi:hypothetical protein
MTDRFSTPSTIQSTTHISFNIQHNVALSILITQLSGHAVRLFPATVRGPGEGRQTRSTNKEGQSKESLRQEEVGSQIQYEVAALTTPAAALSKTIKTKLTTTTQDKTSLWTSIGVVKTKRTVSADPATTQKRHWAQQTQPLLAILVVCQLKVYHGVSQGAPSRKMRLPQRCRGFQRHVE